MTYLLLGFGSAAEIEFQVCGNSIYAISLLLFSTYRLTDTECTKPNK